MKLILSFLLASFVFSSVASDSENTRRVSLTFVGSTKKIVFFIKAGLTKQEIFNLLKQQCRATVQQPPKTIIFTQTGCAASFPEILTSQDLEQLSPDGDSIQLKVIEYEQPKKPSRF